MVDLVLAWGDDLAFGPAGDFATIDGPGAGTQRVLRRMMTQQGGYVWNLDYGAGLAQFLGQPMQAVAIQALILAQMRREAVVATQPEPVVEVSGDSGGTLSARIRYADAVTAATQTADFNIPG